MWKCTYSTCKAPFTLTNWSEPPVSFFRWTGLDYSLLCMGRRMSVDMSDTRWHPIRAIKKMDRLIHLPISMAWQLNESRQGLSFYLNAPKRTVGCVLQRVNGPVSLLGGDERTYSLLSREICLMESAPCQKGLTQLSFSILSRLFVLILSCVLIMHQFTMFRSFLIIV